MGLIFLDLPSPHEDKDEAKEKVGVPLPHLRAPGLGSPLPHLRRDWARPCHICAGTGLTPATSAPGQERSCAGCGSSEEARHKGLLPKLPTADAASPASPASRCISAANGSAQQMTVPRLGRRAAAAGCRRGPLPRERTPSGLAAFVVPRLPRDGLGLNAPQRRPLRTARLRASPGADVGESRRRCGRVPAQIWASPGADMGESRRRYGRVPAQIWASPGADVAQHCSAQVAAEFKAKLRVLIASTSQHGHAPSAGTRPHLHRDSPTSAPGLAHICAGIRPHLHRDSPTSAPGFAHICTGIRPHLPGTRPHLPGTRTHLRPDSAGT
jgi:hypothetical protein